MIITRGSARLCGRNAKLQSAASRANAAACTSLSSGANPAPGSTCGTGTHMAIIRAAVYPQAKRRAIGLPDLAGFIGYLAYSTHRVSRITQILIWPGYCISSSIRCAIWREMSKASFSVTFSASTTTRTSRPACTA